MTYVKTLLLLIAAHSPLSFATTATITKDRSATAVGPVSIECAYLLAEVTFAEVDEAEFELAAARGGYVSPWLAPDGQPQNNRTFIFLPRGRLAISRAFYDPSRRQGDQMVTRVVTLDPDGTVLLQTASYRQAFEPKVSTERWTIDVNHAHLILGFARYHARRGDPLLIEALDLLRAELPPGTLD